MQLRLTLVGGDASTEPVLVTATPGDTVGDLVALLVQEGRLPGDARLEVGESALVATDPIGLPPLLDGAVVRVTTGGRRSERLARAGRIGRSATSPIRLEVVGGPDAGACLPLSPGRHRIGRGPFCELSVTDAHLSRVHAAMEVTTAGITVTDVSSTNGLARVAPDGELTAFATGTVTVGDHIRLGTTTLAVRAGLARPLSGRPAGDGTVAVARTSGRSSGWAPATLVRPAPPTEAGRPRFPWVQVLLPLPVCAVLAWLWGPQMLVFALLGPLLAGGSAISDRVGARRSGRTESARHAAAVAAHEAARRDAAAAERTHLLTVHPDPATVVAVATTPTTRLWERVATSGGSLAIRLGTSTVRGASAETGPTGARECILLAEAPVTVDLATVGSLGIDGHCDLVSRSGAWVVTQLAALVAPSSLSIDVVGDDEEWEWVQLLPHAVDRSADVVAALRARLEEPGPRSGPSDRHDRAAVLLVPDPRLVTTLPGLAHLLADGPTHGVHVVVLDPAGHGLPAGLGATLHVQHDPSATHLSMSGGSREAGAAAAADARGAVVEGRPLVADGLSRSRAEKTSRALAPLRHEHPGPDVALPDRLALTDLTGTPTPQEVLRGWAARHGPVAVVGTDASGPMTIDLRRDGPHALVGGTTGAGKSELLRTLVAALALGSAPEDLAFVLVDYKGGAAFGDLADLPHVAAVVTDLDAELVERALVSLTAELRRRERILATTGAGDLAEHLARGGERLPRLVIVVDELRALVDELPAFVQGLVRIASLGRSLGVHLVLATQRPAGVVSADIAANVNLRIALRVRDRVDSEAIVGTPHAAALPASTPGRAIAAVAGAETTFQSALVTPDECPEPPLSVQARGWVATGPPRPVPRLRPSGMAELIRDAGRAGGHRPAPPPWQPPMPESLPWTPAPDEAVVSLGLVDLPEEQRTDVLAWDPRSDGHLAILGAPRSGRTTALVTVVGAVLAVDSPWHVHVLQATNALGGLSRSRSVGSVVSLHDRELVGRFVERLEAEVARRRDASGGGTASPSLLVAIDGWDVLAGQVTDLAGHELVERLLAVLRDGPALGVHAVATGGRALVQGRTGERFSRRLALGSVDAAEALHLGLPVTRGGGARPAGRGTDVRSGHLCHLARHGTGPGVEDDVRTVVSIDRRRARIGPGPAPFRIEPLPARVDPTRLRGQAGAIGVGADLEPIGFRPTDLHVLVVGPRGSGRSTALRALARSWSAQGRRVLLVAERPVDGVVCLTPDRVPDLADRLRDEPRTALLVDDVDHHADTRLEALVLEAVATAARRGAPVAVSADSAALVTAFRGAAVQVAARRTGLLLVPRGAADGDVLGVRVRAPRGGPPGRGLIVRDGVAEVVQVVTDERAPSSRGHEPPHVALQ